MKTERLSVEEMANCATHGVGLVLSLVGLVVLVTLAATRGGALHLASCVVYGASLVALYLSSTLYHGARTPRAKDIFRLFDHCCIYLLIAGTYTPFTLVTLRGAWGWTLFGLVWTFAAVGITCRLLFGERYRVVAVASYVMMGWLAVIAVKPIFEIVPVGALVWIAAGGLAYTAGVFFFACKRVPHNHAIWHVFVLCGSVCHYLAVMLYVIPFRP
ncbi:MAG TPA: hemolysin III family protein [Pyrinomonadaceae bacterium]|nr:hemolysin III family protein [Pyrinomonadaceae bacterium]